MDNGYGNTDNNNSEESSCYRYSASEIPKDDLCTVNSYHYEEQSNTNQTPYMEAEEISSSNKKNRKHRKKGNIKLLYRAVAFGLIASIVFLCTNEIFYTAFPEKRSGYLSHTNSRQEDSFNNSGNDQQIETTKTSDTYVMHDSDVSKVVEQTMPSIVAITSHVTQSYSDWFGQQYEKEGEGSGSGIIVGKNDNELLIVTNNHVVEGAKTIGVTFIDSKVYKAEIKGTDRTADLAVIAIPLKSIKEDSMKKIKIAKLGDSDSIKVGQMAIAIGNALGYGQSTTVGYISAKERKVTVDNRTMTLLQTDAAINPGNSGGALLNLSGEVIGINSVKYADNTVEGMGFAIPITRAIPIINDLMKREKIKEGEEGFLGVSGNTVEDSMVQGYGWPEGVYVQSVIKTGPAEKAGIMVRDIITKIDDTQITSMEAMQEKIRSLKAGTKVTVTVMRLVNGEFVAKKIVVTLERKNDVMKDDDSNTNQSENDLQVPNQIPDQKDNGEQSIPEDPFSDFFGNSPFSIPGFGN